MQTRERPPARMNKRITSEQRQALAEALEMRPEEINLTDAFAALREGIRRGRGDIDEAAEILLDAGVIVEVRAV